MENDLEFNLQDFIYNWAQDIKKQPSFTDSDVEELKSHFLDIVDDLKTKGLDEEEACFIASKRLGSSLEWEGDYKVVNNSVIQLKKSVIILSGIIAYFFSYYLAHFSSKLFLLISLVLDVEGFTALKWVEHYLISILFLLILVTTSICLLEKRVLKFIEKINFSPRKIIYFLLITFFIGIIDSCIFPIIKNIVENRILKSHLIQNYILFNYAFPILVCICFLCIYLKYNKKNKA